MFFRVLFVRIIVSIKKKSLEKIKKYHKMSCEGIFNARQKDIQQVTHDMDVTPSSCFALLH